MCKHKCDDIKHSFCLTHLVQNLLQIFNFAVKPPPPFISDIFFYGSQAYLQIPRINSVTGAGAIGLGWSTTKKYEKTNTLKWKASLPRITINI